MSLHKLSHHLIPNKQFDQFTLYISTYSSNSITADFKSRGTTRSDTNVSVVFLSDIRICEITGGRNEK